MPDVPAGAKVPADRKRKSEPVEDAFSFEHDGETYTFKPTLDHLTPGFVRRNRDNEVEFYYALLEMLAGDDALAVLDDMTFKENSTIMRQFGDHADAVLKVSLGE